MSSSTAERRLPRYPVWIPTKGRYAWDRALTARWLAAEGVPFRMAVESKEVEAYGQLVDRLELSRDVVVDIGYSDRGEGAAPCRNLIREWCEAEGAARHWQLDDNCHGMWRWYRRRRIPMAAGLGLRLVEDFTDRYENVALSGPTYVFFQNASRIPKPFTANVHVYSCTLVNHLLKARWRGPYNADTDICLQALAAGWCTILFEAFAVGKQAAFNSKGIRIAQGGMSSLYEGDGRLRMARSLERRWPGVVTVTRRFRRPQHLVDWKKFDTPLKLRDDIDLSKLPPVDELGMELTTVREPKSEVLRRMVDEYGGGKR